jgi:Concanavalin A-like lectin/glucanases superfamily
MRVSLAVFVTAAVLLLPASAVASPLAGYWPMHEGKGQVVHDISGNGNHGRLGSSRSTDGRDADWVTGLFGVGSALRFDGNDYISIPDAKSLHQQRLTVEAWAKRDGSPGQFKYIVSKGGDNCEAASYGLYSSINGGIAFYVYDGKKWYRSPQGSPKIWDGQWHHIAGTYDGKKVRLFVDGFEIGTGTPFSGKIKYEQPYGEGALGAYRGSCKLTLSGVVDEVRIWQVALPVKRIWGLINKGLRREPAAPLPEDTSLWFAGGR